MDLTDLLPELEADFPLPPTDPTVLQDWVLEQQEKIAAQTGAIMADLTSKFLNKFIDSITAAGDYTIINEFIGGWTGLANSSLGPQVLGMYTSGAVEAWIQAPNQNAATVAERWAPVVNDNAMAYQQEALLRIVNAGTDTLREVQNVTLNKLRTGQDPRELRADIQEVTGFSKSRAETIARTEVIGAYNNGNMAGARELGEFGPVKKEWSSFIDNRTRDSHIEADGQTVWFEDTFEVGGEQMDAPHDPGADPAEVINCRCQVILLYEGDIDRDGNVVTRELSADVDPDDVEAMLEEQEPTVAVDGPTGIINVPQQFVYYENGERIVDFGAWNRANAEKREMVMEKLVSTQSPISAQVQASANVYQSAFGMFDEINGALRTGASSQLKDMHLANLDAMFQDRLPVNATLFRGRQFKDARELNAHMKGLTPGAKISDAGFMSTTLDEGIASQFGGFGKRPAVTYEIRAKAESTRYRVLEGTESEILLPRNTELRVVSVEKGVSMGKFDTWNIVLEIFE